jgi:hypothetical protein
MDAYPMRSQNEILAKVAKAKYIIVLDAILFYYQWRYVRGDRSLYQDVCLLGRG